MSLKFTKNIVAGVLACFAGVAMANHVTLVNTSQAPITVTYKIAHKNLREMTVYSSAVTAQVVGSAAIGFDLGHYELGGIVPIAVNGLVLPKSINQFNTPKQCSVTTDKTHTTGELRLHIIYTDPSHQHGEISCSQQGGIFG